MNLNTSLVLFKMFTKFKFSLSRSLEIQSIHFGYGFFFFSLPYLCSKSHHTPLPFRGKASEEKKVISLLRLTTTMRSRRGMSAFASKPAHQSRRGGNTQATHTQQIHNKARHCVFILLFIKPTEIVMLCTLVDSNQDVITDSSLIKFDSTSVHLFQDHMRKG